MRQKYAAPEDRPHFADLDNGHVLFLRQGLVSKRWGTFYLGPRGALKRFKSPILPMRLTRARAEFELRALAARRGWVEV